MLTQGRNKMQQWKYTDMQTNSIHNIRYWNLTPHLQVVCSPLICHVLNGVAQIFSSHPVKQDVLPTSKLMIQINKQDPSQAWIWVDA